MGRIVAFILMTMALAGPLSVMRGQEPPSRAGLVTTLDSIAGGPVARKLTTGLVAAVVKGTDTLLFKGYGRADVEWDVPMPTDAVFEIGSIGKQFTAAAVLKLRDAGKLSLDDDITAWLPDFDTRGYSLPLRRLLDHTSGIHGLTEMQEFRFLAVNPFLPRDSAYALIKRYPFTFRPGTAQIYNNSAFWLLGMIIERASGASYEDYLEQQIFTPLGMANTRYCHSAEDVPRRAHGYVLAKGVVRRAATNVHTWPWAAGSVCSTAGDMLTWLLALHGGRVLSPASYREMTTPATLADGTVLRYGMGLEIGRNVGGQMVIGHGGTIDGFRAEASWYPEAHLAIVVLANSVGGVNPAHIVTDIGASILPWKEPVFAEFAGDPTPLLGTYKGPARGREMIVEVVNNGGAVAFSLNGSPPRALPYRGGLAWQGGDVVLAFRRMTPDGPVTELRFDGGSGSYYILARQ